MATSTPTGGRSPWLWTEDHDGWSGDQWEVYDGGQVLRYDLQHGVDQCCMLVDQRVDPVEYPLDVVDLSEAEYRSATDGLRPMNR